MTLRQMDIWEYMSDRGILYGRTSQEHLAPTVERTLGSCLKKSAKSQTKIPLFLDLRGSGSRQDVSWETDGVSLGEHMMHNTGEFRKDEREFVFSLISGGVQQERYCLNCSEKPLMEKKVRLSDILEESANPKYNLSAKACQGILRRANVRGKKLPEVLERALIAQSHFKNEPEKQGGVKESSSKTNEPERSAHYQTSTYCIEGNVIDRQAKQNGRGWKAEEAYTLNSVDRHGVAYGVDAYNHTTTGDVTMSITGAASDPHHIPCVIENEVQHETYQETTGTLTPGAHAGSYNGQDAYNDMLVTFSKQRTDQYKENDVASCVSARDYKSETDQVCFAINAHSAGVSENVSQTLLGEKNDNHHPCVYGQSSFGQYTDGCGTLKANGGDIGGGQRNTCDTVGSLCARDYKGVGSQYVDEGKVIVQKNSSPTNE